MLLYSNIFKARFFLICMLVSLPQPHLIDIIALQLMDYISCVVTINNILHTREYSMIIYADGCVV